MSKLVEGTSIIEGAKPDSEVIEESTEKSFDDDFNYLAPPAKKEEEQKKDESSDDKITETKLEDTSEKEVEKVEEKVEKKEEHHEERSDSDLSELRSQLSAKDTELQSVRTELETAKSHLEGLKNVEATLAEINANPLAFVKKYFPQLADAINPRKIIAEKLKAEFGPDFQFDPSEAFMEGTRSYDYRLREEEVRDELRNQEYKIERERAEREARLKTQTEQDINQIMKDYNLTREQVHKEVIEWAKNTPNNLVNIAKLRFYNQNVERAVKKALAESKARKASDKLPDKGVKDIHGASEEKPQHLKELEEDFGEKY